MSNRWQLQTAKNRLSNLVDKALKEGPQIITRRGKEAVVVVAVDHFRLLSGKRMSLVEFLQSSPLSGVDLDIDRASDAAREVEL